MGEPAETAHRRGPNPLAHRARRPAGRVTLTGGPMSTVRSPAHAPTSVRAEQTLMTNEPMVLNNPSPTSRTAGNIGSLPIQSLKTSYASLRPGAIHQPPHATTGLATR